MPWYDHAFLKDLVRKCGLCFNNSSMGALNTFSFTPLTVFLRGHYVCCFDSEECADKCPINTNSAL